MEESFVVYEVKDYTNYLETINETLLVTNENIILLNNDLISIVEITFICFGFVIGLILSINIVKVMLSNG